MLMSVVMKTKDEADRLRLVLASLSRQTVPFVAPGSRVAATEPAAELIVVDDGSTDHTRDVLDEAAHWLPLCARHHDVSRGRTATSNLGASQAAGDVLLFLDGDNMVSPGAVEMHARAHAGGSALVRGETFHLRCTRFFRDPETGRPMPGQEERVARLGADLPRHLVRRRQVLDHFEEIEARAEPGIYPGAGPRMLCDLEMDAMENHPDLGALWMAATGQNLSVRRDEFEAVGGFDERITCNEHRELAFRLSERGHRLALAPGARSYHLTHRIGWRDPMRESDWERLFFEAHPCLAVKLMSVFWLSLAGSKAIPEEARITSLPQFDRVVRQGTTIDYDAIRRAHPMLADLG
jgi:glycosyltransferase involved in cell wall biosynthesis